MEEGDGPKKAELEEAELVAMELEQGVELEEELDL